MLKCTFTWLSLNSFFLFEFVSRVLLVDVIWTFVKSLIDRKVLKNIYMYVCIFFNVVCTVYHIAMC